MSKHVMRLLTEKEIKHMLIQAAKNQGVSLQDIVEWLLLRGWYTGASFLE